MSRCLESCLRSLRSAKVRPHTIASARRVPAAGRYYGQAAARVEDHSSSSQSPEAAFSRSQRQQGQYGAGRAQAEEGLEESGTLGPSKPPSVQESSEQMAKHLNGLFAPLIFPSDLAHRVLTHGSHVSAKYGSNGALGFTGRRVLECYLNLFLTASKELKPTHNLEDIAERALNPNLLGEQLGGRWGFSKVLNWTPAVTRSQLEATSDPASLIRRIGLHKVQGEAVAAVLGAIYVQFGGSIAHRVFHTRMLPHLLVRGGLPTAFHAEAEALAKRMGGPDGNLLHAHGKTQFDDSPSPSSPGPSHSASASS